MKSVERSWLLPYFPHLQAWWLDCQSLTLQRRCVPCVHCLRSAHWPTLHWVMALPELHVSPSSYPETWWYRVVISCPWDLMPDDLSWSWCNDRNKAHSEWDVPESPQTSSPPWSVGKRSSMKLVPGAKEAGDCRGHPAVDSGLVSDSVCCSLQQNRKLRRVKWFLTKQSLCYLKKYLFSLWDHVLPNF